MAAQALLTRADRSGQVPVLEILVNVPAVANLIREGKTHQISSMMQTGRAHGMATFDTSIHDLIQKGLISKEEQQLPAPPQLRQANSPAPAIRESVWQTVRLRAS